MHSTCTSYTRRSAIELHEATPTINYRLLLEKIKTFDVGDFVMVRICPEQFPPGTVKKLHACNAGPFQILKKFNDNAYVINLSKNFSNSYTFNVEDLVDYKGPNFNQTTKWLMSMNLSLFLRAPHFLHSQIFYPI